MFAGPPALFEPRIHVACIMSCAEGREGVGPSDRGVHSFP